MDMTNPDARIKVIAGATAAILAVIVIGTTGAIAAARVLSPSEESKAVLDDAAQQLGVEPSELSDALKQALENQLDRAVEQGLLTEEQAQRLEEGLDSGALPLFRGFGHRGSGPQGWGYWHKGPGHWRFGGLEAAASYLGVTEAELRAELAGGKTLAQVAEAEGKSIDGLVDAMVASAERKIDAAVADGKLTEEQATRAKDGLEERVTALVKGEARGKGMWRGHGRGFHGPPWAPRGSGEQGPGA